MKTESKRRGRPPAFLGEGKLVSVNLPKEAVEWLDHQRKKAREVEGVKINRSEAIRRMIDHYRRGIESRKA
jgi:metal-responsive CopG/Arc/MetJ family transcriptional regulator